MQVDPYVLTFSALTVFATIFMGFWAARKSKTAHDFFVAGRSVSVGWNASAISGEYLSAASFMGIAGMVMSSGYDALWYPVCYACGYLFLLLFIAGPLRRFGAYTIPDFAEGRFDSPVFRKIAVVFVLFIGFFYTMPQMKGAGTTLAYIFPGLPYWAGVVLVGAVITLNVALGGMKGITLVQAFQYWAKMFAISVPIFVLMAVYGHYGKQLELNSLSTKARPRFDAPLAGQTYSLSTIDAILNKDAKWLVKEGPTRAHLAKINLWPKPTSMTLDTLLHQYGYWHKGMGSFKIYVARELSGYGPILISQAKPMTSSEFTKLVQSVLATNGITFLPIANNAIKVYPTAKAPKCEAIPVEEEIVSESLRAPLPDKAPKDATWLSPFGPLTTKAAKAAATALTNRVGVIGKLPLRSSLSPTDKMTVNIGETNLDQALVMYADLTGRALLPRRGGWGQRIEEMARGGLSRMGLMKRKAQLSTGIAIHGDGLFSAVEVKERLEALFQANGVVVIAEGGDSFRAVQVDSTTAGNGDALASLYRSWLQIHERPLALLYTYSLIIALVCGTAGLPHILVRFYTNPDGVAAKRTTMWVMILIGIFYVFPPVFGVMGRNLFPDLYTGIGAKGTDKIVLELPRLLNDRYPPLGSILSGITCAGAFAAFMSTFSGLLVSMTGALAHDVYGRMLRPQSTPAQRMKAFKVCAVVVGGVAILLGMQVEPFQINFMVGQAFAIAAASYFPLLFMSTWWRGMTTKGAATGMLTGGTLALLGISLTSFSDLAVAGGKTAGIFAAFKPLDEFWKGHPLLRIICEQPAIWAVPLAIALMIVVSKLTRKEIPADIRMKMLVLHAPEALGLKQEYIQEHQSH